MDLYNYIVNQIDYYNNKRIHTTILDIPANYRRKFKVRKSQLTTLKTSVLEENLLYGELGGWQYYAEDNLSENVSLVPIEKVHARLQKLVK